MKSWYLSKLLRFLNKNFLHSNNGEQTIWYFKDKVVALWDNGELEILADILKEGLLKSW